MKRNKLIKHLETSGCVFNREGGNHTVFINPKTLQISVIPRHNEIDDILCNKICKQLEIPKIK